MERMWMAHGFSKAFADRSRLARLALVEGYRQAWVGNDELYVRRPSTSNPSS